MHLPSSFLWRSASVIAMTVCAARPIAAQTVANGTLTVELSGLGNTNGDVCISIFDHSEGFPNNADAVVTQQCIAADDISHSDESRTTDEADLVVTFPNIVAGTYAISVLHDENGDRQVNQGAFGIPTEGFGFSRNPTIRTSAPEFSEAAVFVLGNVTTQIEMIYF